MKHLETITFSSSILGAILFNIFFWEESLGFNAVCYAMLCILGIATLKKNQVRSQNVKWSLLGFAISALMVLIYNSSIAVFSFIISGIITIGFLQQNGIRSILFALPSAFAAFFKSFSYVSSVFPSFKIYQKYSHQLGRTSKLVILPLFVLGIFLFIFKAANPVFDELTISFFDGIINAFEVVFNQISIPRLLFTLLGFGLTGWFLAPTLVEKFYLKERLKGEVITRNQAMPRPKPKFKNEYHPVSLKNEYRTALILLVLINLLTGVVNAIDIQWIWFGFEFEEGMVLHQLVHEGTYFLILSILMAMGIILFYFRKNLNFFPKNQNLKLWAKIWVAQNVIMVISVALRNFHYISYYGLAYKRIGVFIFLTLTLFGLATLILKIERKYSFFNLLRMNGWAAFAMMVCMSFVDWDVLIAKHNVAHNYKENIDKGFLLSLSPKTLPILLENTSILKEENDADHFARKANHFLSRREDESFWSWNYAEWKAAKQLEKIKQEQPSLFEVKKTKAYSIR